MGRGGDRGTMGEGEEAGRDWAKKERQVDIGRKKKRRVKIGIQKRARRIGKG